MLPVSESPYLTKYIQAINRWVFCKNNQKPTTVIFLTFTAMIKTYKFVFYIIFILLYFLWTHL